jgi:hypothetical protein
MGWLLAEGVRKGGRGVVVTQCEEGAPGATVMKMRGIAILKRAVSICLLVALTAGMMTVAQWLGSRPDPDMARLLSLPGVVEGAARRAAADRGDKAGEAKPPLIAQAEIFALYLNLPQAPRRTPPLPRARVARVEATPVAAVTPAPQFRLVGISYHRTKSEESRALVGDSGGGLNWVAQGAEMGRAVVRRINQRSILYEDAAGVHEMELELEATPTAPAQKPQDRQPPRQDTRVAMLVDVEPPQAREELPPVAGTDVNEPQIERPLACTEVEPKPEKAPPRSTPGRRPRPVRSVARQG